MEALRRNRLAEIMATGDDLAAEVALYLEFGTEVNAVVRASVRAQGGLERLDADDLDDLTYDACAELFRIRRSWRPDGGALPWRWARARIDAIVRDRIGPPRRALSLADLNRSTHESRAVVRDEDLTTRTLRTLAAIDDRAQLAHKLVCRLEPRAAELLLRYQIQQDAGDPSPSHTVGAEFGLRPPAVRQAVARARRKLSAAVDCEPTFASLRASPLLGMPNDVAA